jgi:hypothetical protein
VLNNPKRSRKTFCFARSGIYRGEQEKKPDHCKYKRTGQKSGNAELRHDFALLLLGIKAAVEIGAQPTDSNADASDQKGDTHRANEPSPEWLGKQLSRPFMGDLITVASAVGTEDRPLARTGFTKSSTTASA